MRLHSAAACSLYSLSSFELMLAESHNIICADVSIYIKMLVVRLPPVCPPPTPNTAKSQFLAEKPFNVLLTCGYTTVALMRFKLRLFSAVLYNRREPRLEPLKCDSGIYRMLIGRLTA